MAPDPSASGATLLTVISPAFNEAENLPLLYKRLAAVLDEFGVDWEWVVIDDHSGDPTFAVLSELAGKDPRVRAVRFTRNFGAHTAIRCGLDQARGDCAVILASDLQDPPEALPELLREWRAGARVVWAARNRREGESRSKVGFARLYYGLMRRLVGLREMPAQGADFFLVDREVISALSQFGEGNLSLLALITWMGFRQAVVTYEKQARVQGRSGWSLEKKLKLVIDSITSFTYLPIRLISYVGFVCALIGFGYAGSILVRGLAGGGWPEGWASLMVTVLVLGGIQMLIMGVLGEYLWRTLEESRRRPRYLIEARVDPAVEGRGEARG